MKPIFNIMITYFVLKKHKFLTMNYINLYEAKFKI